MGDGSNETMDRCTTQERDSTGRLEQTRQRTRDDRRIQLLNGYGRTKAKRHEEHERPRGVYERAGAHALRQPKLATDIDASGGRLAETSPHGGHLIARDLPLAGECDGRLTPGRGEP